MNTKNQSILDSALAFLACECVGRLSVVRKLVSPSQIDSARLAAAACMVKLADRGIPAGLSVREVEILLRTCELPGTDIALYEFLADLLGISLGPFRDLDFADANEWLDADDYGPGPMTIEDDGEQKPGDWSEQVEISQTGFPAPSLSLYAQLPPNCL